LSNGLFRKTTVKVRADRADMYTKANKRDGAMKTTASKKERVTTYRHIDHQSEDQAVFDHLKPFLRRCLALNHEINNSLAGIFGYSEFLLREDDPLSDNQRRQLEKTISCAERIRAEMESLGNLKARLSKKVDISALVEGLTRESEDSQ
jgi:signal transduction histidine kinase